MLAADNAGAVNVQCHVVTWSRLAGVVTEAFCYGSAGGDQGDGVGVLVVWLTCEVVEVVLVRCLSCLLYTSDAADE